MRNNSLNVKAGILVLAATMMMGLGACGGSYSEMTASGGTGMKNSATMAPEASMEYAYGYDGAMSDEAYMEESPVEAGSTSASNDETGAYYDDRKLIRTVNLDLETKEFDVMLGLVEDKVSEQGGYIENLNTYNGSSYSGRSPQRYSNLTIRIPKDKLEGFLDSVSEVGNVVSRSESVEDVTLAYVDMESRRNSLETEQERLLTFLESAQSLEEIITLEERLSEVRYQLESMESQLRTYDNKIDFATVHMSIQEVKELTPVKEESVGERLVGGFIDSLKDVGNGLVEFFIWIVVHLPYLAVWAIVITIIVVTIKLIIRRNRKKKAAKQKESEK